jgi:hypothetical protein
MAIARLASGGALLFILVAFGPLLIDAFAHGAISWLRSLIVALILSSADVSAIMLILSGLRRLHTALIWGAVAKAAPKQER